MKSFWVKIIGQALFIACLGILIGCRKPGKVKDCQECRSYWLFDGTISKSETNCVSDIRGYYLSHQDYASLHAFDNDTLEVWGYRWVNCDYGRLVSDSVSVNDTAWLIAISPMPYDNESPISDSDYDSIIKFSIRATLKGEAITLAKNNPNAKLLMRCKPKVKLLEATLPAACSHCYYTEAEVTLDILDLKISTKP